MVNFPMRKILCDSIYSNTSTYFLMAKFLQIVYHINIYYPKKYQDKPLRIDGVLFEVYHMTPLDGRFGGCVTRDAQKLLSGGCTWYNPPRHTRISARIQVVKTYRTQ